MPSRIVAAVLLLVVGSVSLADDLRVASVVAQTDAPRAAPPAAPSGGPSPAPGAGAPAGDTLRTSLAVVSTAAVAVVVGMWVGRSFPTSNH